MGAVEGWFDLVKRDLLLREGLVRAILLLILLFLLMFRRFGSAVVSL